MINFWSSDGFYRSQSEVQNNTSTELALNSSLRACHGQVTGNLELAGLETLVARPRAYPRCLMMKPFGCEQSHTLESLDLKHEVTKFNLWREAAADFFVVDVELLVDLCRNSGLCFARATDYAIVSISRSWLAYEGKDSQVPSQMCMSNIGREKARRFRATGKHDLANTFKNRPKPHR